MVCAPGLPPSRPSGIDYGIADTLFKEGKAAMIMNGPWSIASYLEAGIDVGLATIPVVSSSGTPGTPFVGVKLLMLANNAKQPEAAAALMVLTLIITVSSGYAFSKFRFRGREGILNGMLALHAFYQQLIALRRAHPALRTGAYRRVLATPDVYAFARTLGSSTLLVAVNVAEGPHSVEVPLDGLTVREGRPAMLIGSGSAVERQGSTLQLALAPRSGVVLDLSAAYQ